MTLSYSVSLTNTETASICLQKKKRLLGPAISNTASKMQLMEALSPSTSPVCTSSRTSVIQRDSRCFDFKCTENANQLSKSHFWITSPQIKRHRRLHCRTYFSNTKQTLLQHLPGHLYPRSFPNIESPCLFPLVFTWLLQSPIQAPLLFVSIWSSAACQGMQHWQLFLIYTDGE